MIDSIVKVLSSEGENPYINTSRVSTHRETDPTARPTNGPENVQQVGDKAGDFSQKQCVQLIFVISNVDIAMGHQIPDGIQGSSGIDVVAECRMNRFLYAVQLLLKI